MGFGDMKTKIIYISGSEVFDMADIRAAFDTVRETLGLDNDTILFGVPVDADNAFENNAEQPQPKEAPVVVPVDIAPITNDTEPVATPDITEEEPVEKPKRTTRRAAAKVVPITSAKSEPETSATKQQTKEAKPDEPAIPILSVLGAKPDSDEETNVPSINETIDTASTDVAPENTVSKAASIIDPDTQMVSIADMLADDDVPVEPGEKTLEDLLESMPSLAADEKSISTPIVEPEPEIELDSTPVEKSEPTDDTDATLELLAAEFAESEDKIVTPTKTETRGKIGKLKNILPFKKAKRDDSGIMGDLFGWAGVANDEDFTIPGFFANASSKK